MNKKKRREEEAQKEKAKQARRKAYENSPTAKKEKEQARVEYAKYVLQRSKSGSRNPSETLKSLYEGKKVDLPTTSWLNDYKYMLSEEKGATREALYRLLSRCVDRNVNFSRGRMTGHRSFANALKGLAYFHEFWIRPVEEWKPTSHNVFRQFNSLARHLFAKYHVPVFMDEAFYTGNAIHQDWFIHLGSGGNIRTAPKLPIPLTKKSAHHMMLAPDDYDIPAAIRWGQIRAMGGDERLIRAYLKTRMGTNFTNDAFWSSVIQWFMTNPMLDTNMYAPLVDYIHNQRFIASVPTTNGPLVPPQPNMSMKKRDVDATIKAMEEWHKRTGREQRAANVKCWNSSGIPEFHYQEGGDRLFTIMELLSANELKKEGAAMSHCVGSYATSCLSGRISIWSLRENGERLLTIEVDNSIKTIRQARGRFNEKPTHKAHSIMSRWATSASLSISRWLI